MYRLIVITTMMNFGIFAGLKEYAGKWQLKSVTKFSQEEINLVDHVSIVPSDYGSSACFFMKSGGTCYIPMSTDARSQIGDTLKIEDLEILTLCKAGEDDILRIRG